ncbi:MAG: class I SAM-dependent methyltransferase [Dehalococcoidia bacterium]|nr:class I SAM-dependent methyltransferase [Dehalococcoidia bacterium]
MAGHRKFAAAWDWKSRHEGRQETALRREAMAGLEGHVLEIGYGVGSNWRFLPAATAYTGIERDPFMRARATRHMPLATNLALVGGDAERLPFADEAFDAVAATLVFCTISDPVAAMSEVLRVLKPGGQFRFFEHVRAGSGFGEKMQDLATPLWRRIGAGCCLNRDTVATVVDAGFEIVSLRRLRQGPLPMVVGAARRPAGTQEGESK